MCKPFRDYLNVVLDALDKKGDTVLKFLGYGIAIWLTCLFVDAQKEVVAISERTATVLQSIEVRIQEMGVRIRHLETLSEEQLKKND